MWMKAALNPPPVAATRTPPRVNESGVASRATNEPELRCSQHGSVHTWHVHCFLTVPATPPRSILTPQHSVVLGNAAFRKSTKTRELSKARGARLRFLPSCSSDRNPVEQDFATLKKRREYQPDQTLDDLIKYYR